jgi:Flp pilus assembly protein TadG
VARYGGRPATSQFGRRRGQGAVEFALIAPLLFLLMLGMLDFGRAVVAYVGIAEAAHEGARQLVLRGNATSSPPDSVIVNATLAKIGGGGIVLTEDPCLAAQSTPCPSIPTTPNTGYIWLTPSRPAGNVEVKVKITYYYSPLTGIIANAVGQQIILTASSSMRAEY